MDEETLKKRKKGLGGSDSGVVLSLSPFKTRRQLWDEKVGLSDDVKMTPAMKRGIVLEPVVADLYKEETGRKLRRSKGILFHKDLPWMLANIDREIVGDPKGPGVFEIKCPGLKVFSQCKREGLPAYAIIQLQHYLEVTGRKWGAFAVFNSERWEMTHFDVERNDEIIGEIIKADADFWKMVEEGEPPEEDVKPLIDLPPLGGSEIVKVQSEKFATAVRELRDAKQIKQEAEALEEAAKKMVMDQMETLGAEVVECDGARVYWKLQNGRKTFDWTLFAKDHPKLDLVKYEKVGTPFRTLRPFFLKEEENE